MGIAYDSIFDRFFLLAEYDCSRLDMLMPMLEASSNSEPLTTTLSDAVLFFAMLLLLLLLLLLLPSVYIKYACVWVRKIYVNLFVVLTMIIIIKDGKLYIPLYLFVNWYNYYYHHCNYYCTTTNTVIKLQHQSKHESYTVHKLPVPTPIPPYCGQIYPNMHWI